MGTAGDEMTSEADEFETVLKQLDPEIELCSNDLLVGVARIVRRFSIVLTAARAEATAAERERCAKIAEQEAVLRTALEIIAGRRQCVDNLMGNADVAIAALNHNNGASIAAAIRQDKGGV